MRLKVDEAQSGEIREVLKLRSGTNVTLDLVNDELAEVELRITAAAAAGVSLQLATSPGAGATSFDINSSPPPAFKVGSIIAIDAYTTQCELRSVTNIVGQTITVAALKYAHASGDAVLIVEPSVGVSPLVYGCSGGSTDDWGPLQRAVIETTTLSVNLTYVAAPAGNMWLVSQPILVSTGSHWRDIGIKTHSSYAPVDAAGAMVMVSNRHHAFTATASDNTFTTPEAHGMGGSGSYSEVNHTKVAFNAPYGETLPGGITAGKVYYINTTPTTTTFTVSATKGGGILDVTSDGAGQEFSDIEELARVYWDNIRADVTIANVNSVRLNLQQPAYITGLRITLSAACTVRSYGLVIGGQIGYVTNAEINPSGTLTTGVFVYGTGITFQGLNSVGGGIGSNTWGVELAGNALSIKDLWSESLDIGIVMAVENRGIDIGGAWLCSGVDKALEVQHGGCSYSVGVIKAGTGTFTVLNDTARGITLIGSAGASPPGPTAVTDYQGTYLGHTQQGQDASDLGYKPPLLAHRVTVVKTSDYTVRYLDKIVLGSSAGGNRIITLPTAVGWVGHEFTIGHWAFAASNTCTVATTSSQTIDGIAPPLTIPQGGTAIVVSDGANWQIVSERA